MTTNMRKIGKKALSMIMNNPINIDILENLVYDSSRGRAPYDPALEEDDDLSEDLLDDSDDSDESSETTSDDSSKDAKKLKKPKKGVVGGVAPYKEIMYEVIVIIINGGSIKQTANDILMDKIGWNADVFRNVIERIKEQDDFLVNPFEVVEGALECFCGSKRVFSYSKQVRSSDEKTTIFAQCVQCNKKWKE